MSAQEAFNGTWQRSGSTLRPERRDEVFALLEAAYTSSSRHYHVSGLARLQWAVALC